MLSTEIQEYLKTFECNFEIKVYDDYKVHGMPLVQVQCYFSMCNDPEMSSLGFTFNCMDTAGVDRLLMKILQFSRKENRFNAAVYRKRTITGDNINTLLKQSLVKIQEKDKRNFIYAHVINADESTLTASDGVTYQFSIFDVWELTPL